MPLWTVTALNDVQAQLEYIAQENSEAAQGMAIKIRTACEALDQFSKIGRAGVVKNTREFVIPNSPFVCVYRIRQGKVEILRLLHEKMMWPQ